MPINGNVNRGNSTTVWEWYFLPLNDDRLGMLKNIVLSEKSSIRFYGSEYYADRSFTELHKKQISAMLQLFYALQE